MRLRMKDKRELQLREEQQRQIKNTDLCSKVLGLSMKEPSWSKDSLQMRELRQNVQRAS